MTMVRFAWPECNGIGKMELIADTGTENHLIMKSRVDPSDPGIHSTDRKIRLATASGITTASERVHEFLKGLGITIDPLMLESTVDAISVGRLVLDLVFSFHWPNGGRAYSQNKKGNKIYCDTKGYVPVIAAETMDHYAAPGISGPIEIMQGESGWRGASTCRQRDASSHERRRGGGCA